MKINSRYPSVKRHDFIQNGTQNLLQYSIFTAVWVKTFRSLIGYGPIWLLGLISKRMMSHIGKRRDVPAVTTLND